MIRAARADRLLRLGILPVVVLFVSAAVLAAADRRGEEDERDLAGRILEATGVKGGLIVHAGCGDGRLTAALRASDRFLVHGLARDPQAVLEARRYLRSQGVHGPVSVMHWTGGYLPYADNLVNLLVCESASDLRAAEIMRVLRPLGVAYVKRTDGWSKTVKPWPKGIDDWTHFLHGPDGNAVAHDSVVGPPYHVQWVGSPKFSRSHSFLTSVNVMVSAGGRLLYVVDEGPAALPGCLPARWTLVARDALSGVVLWKRPLTTWQPFSTHGRIPFPSDLFRRLVAVGDEAYATLSLFGPVTALDAATGEILRTYEGTAGAEEIVCDRGVLYVVLGTKDPRYVDRRLLAEKRVEPDEKRLLAIRASDGAVLWTKKDEETVGILPLALAIQGDRVVYQNVRAIICLDAASGAERWRHLRPSVYARSAWSTPTLLIHDDVVLCADRRAAEKGPQKPRTANAELIALSTKTGEKLWSCPCAEGLRSPVDVFVVDRTVWVGEQPSRRARDFQTGRDLRTGRVKRRFQPLADWVDHHHHRCYRNKATDRFILAGRTGVEFIDLSAGELIPHQFIRGVCRYGVLPCNGLLYLPPSQCACYVESKLNGFYALAPKRDERFGRASDEGAKAARLECGPAYGSPLPRPSTPSGYPPAYPSESWPTYRHDNARSGRAGCPIELPLRRIWSRKVGGKLTSLVSAEGKVLGGQVDEHVVFCLDATTGEPLWDYVAGGRVDSPPTLAEGLVVFGCRDGWVYALRASDGRLAWRFRAAAEDRRIVAQNQLESVWPVHGSVLVEDGFVYFLTGRSSYLDGGVYLYKLRLHTGERVLQRRFYSRDAQTGRHVYLYPPFQGEVLPDREMPGVLPDILSSDAGNLFIRGVVLSPELVIRQRHLPHLFSSMGFLDDTWWERTYWIFGTHFYGGARGQGYAKTIFPAGRILTFDDAHVYGYQDTTFQDEGLFQAAKQPPRIEPIFKRQRPREPSKKGKKRTLQDRIRKAMKFRFDWRVDDLPMYVRAMVLADEALFVAGPPKFDEQRTMELLEGLRTDEAKLSPAVAGALDAFEGRKGALMGAVDKKNGEKLAKYKLDMPPVFDGMIAAEGKLYIATTGGKVICWEGK